MLTRRDFLKAAGAAGAAFAFDPVSTMAAPKKKEEPKVAATEKVKVALIGIGHRGEENAKEVAKTGLADVIALCDVNIGAPHTQKVLGMFPDAKRYQDFRKLFDEMSGQIEAVFISIPDFAHFAVAMRALREGINVYCEKPLSRTFHENELLIQAAKAHPELVTQMGNQGHSGAHYFQFKAWCEAGIIKNVTKINAHMNNSRRWHGFDVNINHWPAADPIPETMDWDLWQMQTMNHEYSKWFDEGNWRCWYDFGMGALGDWGAHIFDVAHQCLDLGLPTEVGLTYEEGHNDYFYPMSSTIKFKFPRRGNMPSCELTWYDGLKNLPEVPAGFGESIVSDVPTVGGAAYVPIKLNPGKEIYTDEYIFKGGSHSAPLEIVPKELHQELDSKGMLPHIPEDYHYNHYKNFLNSVRGLEKPNSPFEVAGPLCQMINLGVIAQRLNTTFHFDRNSKEIIDNPFANAMLTGVPPRKGWEEYYKI